MHGGSQLQLCGCRCCNHNNIFKSLCLYVIPTNNQHPWPSQTKIRFNQSALVSRATRGSFTRCSSDCECLWAFSVASEEILQIRSNNCSEDHVIVAFSWTLIHFNAKLVLQMGAKMFVVSMRLGGGVKNAVELRYESGRIQIFNHQGLKVLVPQTSAALCLSSPSKFVAVQC